MPGYLAVCSRMCDVMGEKLYAVFGTLLVCGLILGALGVLSAGIHGLFGHTEEALKLAGFSCMIAVGCGFLMWLLPVPDFKSIGF